jgi:hypothetical protein
MTTKQAMQKKGVLHLDELLYDPKIPPLGIYTKESKSISMFIIFIAQFAIAKLWNQSVDEWIKNAAYIHIKQFYSAIKKSEIIVQENGWNWRAAC